MIGETYRAMNKVISMVVGFTILSVALIMLTIRGLVDPMLFGVIFMGMFILLAVWAFFINLKQAQKRDQR